MTKKILLLVFASCLCFGQGVVITSGLIGRYLMSNASGTSLPDTSGAANHGTLVGAPMINAGAMYADIGKYATLPAAITSYRTVQVIADFSVYSNLGAPRAIIGSSSPLGLTVRTNAINDDRGGTLAPSIFADSVFTTSTATPTRRLSVLTAVFDTMIDHIYIDGVEVTYAYAQTSSVGNIAGTIQIGASTGASLSAKMPIYEVLFYNRALTAMEVASNSTVLLSDVNNRFPPVGWLLATQTAYANLVLVGDSITNGYGQTPTIWADLLTPNRYYTKWNLGINGYQILFAKTSTGNATQLISDQTPNVVVLYLGINDLISGRMAADVADDIADTALAYKAAGFRVVVVTQLSWPGLDAERDAVNTQVRADWHLYADALADIAAVSAIGADGAYMNPTYFLMDGHPNGAAAALMAPVITNAINFAVGYRQTLGSGRSIGAGRVF